MVGIPLTEVVSRLGVDNPWWQGDSVVSPHYANLQHRLYFDSFFSLISDRSVHRAVILMGPRRVGKTVILHQAIEKLLTLGFDKRQLVYISIDTPIYTGLSLERILQICSESGGIDLSKKCFVFFDEIQYLAGWENHLKSLVDSYRSVKFIASGSAAAALRLKSNESGAGRFTDFLLPPLSFAEYIQFIGKEELIVTIDPEEDFGYGTTNIEELNKHFVEYINYGGYPEAVFSPTIQSNPARFIKGDIIDKVLLKDLPSLYGISDIQDLNRLFAMIAYNTGQEISLDGLAQSSGVSKNTIKRYIEYLEAAFLIGKVRRIDEHCKFFSRERGFKVYLTNTSMRAALYSPVKSTDDELMGHLVETAIFSQWMHSPNILSEVYFARWKKGEIDMVYINKNDKNPIWVAEFKWTDRFYEKPGELSVLKKFCENHAIESALVTTKTVRGSKQLEGIPINYVPSSLYCYTLSKNIFQDF